MIIFLGTGNIYLIYDRYHLLMKNKEIKRYGFAMWLDYQTKLVLSDKPGVLPSFLEAESFTTNQKTDFLIRLQKAIVLIQERTADALVSMGLVDKVIPFSQSEESSIYNEEHFQPMADFISASVKGDFSSVNPDLIDEHFPELELCL